jgi:aspartyl-tRNA(Asn)/glutamyl-tRNA(Gln) amidotransferase subunit A
VTGDELQRLIDEPASRDSISAVELAEAMLERIDAAQGLHAFITVTPELALTDARRSDLRRARREPLGPLDGMPIAVKDNIDVAGVRTTAGSDWLRDHVAAEDAEVVGRLRSAGAVIVGKTMLHEFAYGATSDNPHFGTCRNPWDPTRSPGGSSGGSGAATGADLCFAALGTDTGGSVRVPGALNGVSALRPTYGAVSNWGVLPISPSLDTVGTLARSATDLAVIAGVLYGYDRRDPYAARPSGPGSALTRASTAERLDGLRVAVATGDLFDETEPALTRNAAAVADQLLELGATLSEIELTDAVAAMENCTTLIRAEALAGHRDQLDADPGRFGADVRRRLEEGRSVSGVEFAQALDHMRRWRARMLARFDDVDVILTPTTPSGAPVIDGAEMISTTARLTRFTYPWSLAGLPALSLPSGADGLGLPTGVQLAAAPWRDGLLLGIGQALQRVTDFHRRRPPRL